MKSITTTEFISLTLNITEYLIRQRYIDTIANAVKRKRQKGETFFSVWFGKNYMMSCSYFNMKKSKDYHIVFTLYGNSDDNTLDMVAYDNCIFIDPAIFGIHTDDVDYNDIDNDSLCEIVAQLLSDNGIMIIPDDSNTMEYSDDEYFNMVASKKPKYYS